MFAIARINSFDQDKLTDTQSELEQFARLHASQPGYAGSMTITLGEGRRLTVNLWHSQQQAAAGLSNLGGEVGRVLEPLMSAPSQLLGAGDVETDLSLNATCPPHTAAAPRHHAGHA